MAARRKTPRTSTPVQLPVGNAGLHRAGHWRWLWPFVLGSVIAGVLASMATHKVLSGQNARFRKDLVAKVAAPEFPSLADLAAMSEKELARHDIALLNLRCAEGLPGAEQLDVGKCLATLDDWAVHVRSETDRHLYKFRQTPGNYQDSEAYFRTLMLITVLQQDLDVHYNPDRIRDVDFTKSQDLFIHGMIGNKNGGTCVSMPVLYAAIARRLGYPVYLVTAKAHVFCRWQDAKERLNIEGTSQGLNTYDDAYYMNWPKPITEAEVLAGHYLKSLTPGEEFAVFLSARGHCLEDNGRVADARVCYAQSLTRRPDSPDYLAFLANTLGFRRQSQQAFQQPVAGRQPFEPPMAYPQTFAQRPASVPAGYQDLQTIWPQPNVPTQPSPYNVFRPGIQTSPTNSRSALPGSGQSPPYGFQP